MTHHTDQERIGGYEDCHPVNQIATPLNGGTTQCGEASASTTASQTSRDGLGDSCERGNTKLLQPVAVRYGWDGYGYQYLDNASGSDWLTRHPDAEMLFTCPGRAK